MAGCPVETAAAPGYTILDDVPYSLVKRHALLDQTALFFVERGDISGYAQPAKQAVDHGVDDPTVVILFADHRPDLALPWRDQAMQVGGDNGDILAFMGIGEGSHAAGGHTAGIQTMAAGGAVFQYQIRIGFQ